MDDKLTCMLKRHEGLRLKPYLCTAGKSTIGYGRNLDDKGISEAEAGKLLEHDIHDSINDLTRTYGQMFSLLDYPRQSVLVDMCFNMGIGRLKQFKRMFAALKTDDFQKAADEMMDSAWAKQVGVRADTLCLMMRTGHYD